MKSNDTSATYDIKATDDDSEVKINFALTHFFPSMLILNSDSNSHYLLLRKARDRWTMRKISSLKFSSQKIHDKISYHISTRFQLRIPILFLAQMTK